MMRRTQRLPSLRLLLALPLAVPLVLMACDQAPPPTDAREIGPSPRFEDPPPTEGEGSSTGAATTGEAEEEEECGHDRAIPEGIWSKCLAGLQECADEADEDTMCGETSCDLCFSDFALCEAKCDDMQYPPAIEEHCGEFVP